MTYLRSVLLRRAVVAVAALLVAAVAPARADITIDDFSLPNDPPFTQNFNAAGSGSVTTALPGIGDRTINYTISAEPFGATNATITVSAPPTGSLDVSIGNGASANVSVVYAFTSSLNFIPNVPAGGTAGQIQFDGFSQNSIPAAGNTPTSYTLTVNTATGNLTATGTLDQTLATSSFDLAGLSGTGDLSQVTGLSLNLVAGAGADLGIDFIRVTTPAAPDNPVPAPPAALLALAAIPALGLRRFRRKAA